MFYKLFTEKYTNSKWTELDLMLQGYLPLANTVTKGLEKKNVTAFRTIPISAYKQLEKLQNTKKQFPTFTRGSKGLSFGAKTATEMLVQLKGTSSIQLPQDSSTRYDRSGKVWMNRELLTVRNNFTIPVLKEMNKKFFPYYTEPNPLTYIDERVKEVEEWTGKQKYELIKWYFDYSKKLLTDSLLEKMYKEIESDYAGEFNNDEVILHSFKIEKTWGVEEEIFKGFMDTEMQDEFMDSNFEEEEEFILKNPDHPEYAKDFKKYTSNFINYQGTITRKEIEKIDISKNKYPK